MGVFQPGGISLFPAATATPVSSSPMMKSACHIFNLNLPLHWFARGQ